MRTGLYGRSDEMFAVVTALAIAVVVLLWIGIEQYRLKHPHH